MMTKREAERVARRIAREAPRCRVTGYRRHGRGRYEIDVIDGATGGAFVVRDAADWAERMRAAG
jgi:hypothetical protein